MGGRPLTALSIAAFPDRDFPRRVGGRDRARRGPALAEAGCALLGGHSVRDPEIKFGYAVTGLVDPGRILTNAGGRAGQVLVLTQAARHRDRRHGAQGGRGRPRPQPQPPRR